jgi:hypothetical protein
MELDLNKLMAILLLNFLEQRLPKKQLVYLNNKILLNVKLQISRTLVLRSVKLEFQWENMTLLLPVLSSHII